MSNVKLSKVQKEKVAIFLSEQLFTLKTEKRLGRIHYNRADENFLKSLEEAIRIGIAEEIWSR